ncbi:MAG: hypothetical protein PF495_00420 [Spirochaetales bacterium]|nr:hypothetical protein [Spirochaetales bacterium]
MIKKKFSNDKSVLLSSVFGPYGVDDEYGRKENIIEFFHNQVTREQGIFSLRLFHQSFGLYFIAENIEPATTILDFPSEERFVEEIKKGYAYVGITFKLPNYIKAKRMAELVREHAPKSKIVIGGHGVEAPEVKDHIPHDYRCHGEGVKFFRKILGEDTDRPIKHPILRASFGERMLGVPFTDPSAHLCPGVGCPNACRFCSTSHFFGKAYTPYLETGKDMFDVCMAIEKEIGLTEFFVMDENFLLKPNRALELFDLMEGNRKYFEFTLFSSADNIVRMGVEFLVKLGVTKLWIGAESKFEIYKKNKGIDLKPLIFELRQHGISVIVSAILFLEQHDKEKIWEDIKFIVDLEPDFIQFMQLCPLPNTALYIDYEKKGILMKVPYEEWHGQHRIWFKHPHFTPVESEQYLRDAFQYDYDTWGSSFVRMCDSMIRGCKTLNTFDNPTISYRLDKLRKRTRNLRLLLPGALKYAHNEKARQITEEVMGKFEEEFGPMMEKEEKMSRLTIRAADRESKRIEKGETVYQPKTIVTSFRV